MSPRFAACGVLVATLLLLVQSARAVTASDQERAYMAIEVANYIHYPHDRAFKAGSFNGASAVEIGAAAIEQPGALADWRAAKGSGHGQVAFLYVCDHWNVLKVSNGVPLRAEQIVVQQPFPITKSKANSLVAELARLEDNNVTFLKPARPRAGC